MPIPDYQTIMRPLLELLVDGREHALRDLRSTVADSFKLTVEEREQLLPAGGSPLFADRFSWARYYLQRAGMLERVRRAVYRITDQGRVLLGEVPGRIRTADLRQRSPEFEQWVTGGTIEPVADDERARQSEQQATPEEALSSAYQSLRRAVESDLLGRLRTASPAFFENVVVRLLVAMGYGGSLEDAGRAIGRSGDQGIDGIINEDRLGLDVVYVQAKRWADTVGGPEIQRFHGALAGQRARKGVFITTSTFSPQAKAFVSHVDTRIVLVDGEQLVRLMFDHGVGVLPMSAYEVKKVDDEFFDEE
jgi:restriction system protein